MALAKTSELGFDVALKEVPVTEQRRPFIQKEGDERLKQPGRQQKVPRPLET
jgi:hypothetical protein